MRNCAIFCSPYRRWYHQHVVRQTHRHANIGMLSSTCEFDRHIKMISSACEFDRHIKMISSACEFDRHINMISSACSSTAVWRTKNCAIYAPQTKILEGRTKDEMPMFDTLFKGSWPKLSTHTLEKGVEHRHFIFCSAFQNLRLGSINCAPTT